MKKGWNWVYTGIHCCNTRLWTQWAVTLYFPTHPPHLPFSHFTKSSIVLFASLPRDWTVGKSVNEATRVGCANSVPPLCLGTWSHIKWHLNDECASSHFVSECAGRENSSQPTNVTGTFHFLTHCGGVQWWTTDKSTCLVPQTKFSCAPYGFVKK